MKFKKIKYTNLKRGQQFKLYESTESLVWVQVDPRFIPPLRAELYIPPGWELLLDLTDGSLVPHSPCDHLEVWVEDTNPATDPPKLVQMKVQDVPPGQVYYYSPNGPKLGCPGFLRLADDRRSEQVVEHARGLVTGSEGFAAVVSLANASLSYDRRDYTVWSAPPPVPPKPDEFVITWGSLYYTATGPYHLTPDASHATWFKTAQAAYDVVSQLPAHLSAGTAKIKKL